jgi:hypothetical protein
MDGSRFDAWTRRRFGLAAGGAIGSLLGLHDVEPDDAEAKKRKRRCRKLGQSCTPGGRRKCCKKRGLSCQIFEEGSDARRCCRKGNEVCTDDSDCCSQDCVDGRCACKSNGMTCFADPVCCSLKCAGTCQPA